MYKYAVVQGAALMSNSSTQVLFDSVRGLATITNLYINQTGMFMLYVSVQTVNSNAYNFDCYTNAITVTRTTMTIDSSNEPNILFRFAGNLNAMSPMERERFTMEFYNTIIRPYNISLNNVISLVSGSIVAGASVDTAGTPAANVNAMANSVGNGMTVGGSPLLGASVLGTSVYATNTNTDTITNSDSKSGQMSAVIRTRKKKLFLRYDFLFFIQGTNCWTNCWHSGRIGNYIFSHTSDSWNYCARRCKEDSYQRQTDLSVQL